MGSRHAGGQRGSGGNDRMEVQEQQGAGNRETVSNDDNGHRTKAQGLTDAHVLAGHRTAAMQEQIPHELLPEADAKDAARSK